MGLPQALGLLAGDFFGVFLGVAFLGVGLFLGVAFLGVGDFLGVVLVGDLAGLPAFLGVGDLLGVVCTGDLAGVAAFLGDGNFFGVLLAGDLAGLLVGVDMGDNHLVTRGHVGVEQGTHTTNSTTKMGKQNCLTTHRCLPMG